MAARRPVVRRGSRGPHVSIVQTAIGVTSDGIFGPATERAVIDWQRRHGLVPDGIVGRLTWATIVATVQTLTTRQELVLAVDAPHGLELYGNPNSNRRRIRTLWGALLHHTGSVDAPWQPGYCARNPLLGGGLCCHAVIRSDGTIVLIAERPDDVAWHAGLSLYALAHIYRLKRGKPVKPAKRRREEGRPRSPSNRRGGMNSITVGIELCTDGPITQAQYESTVWLLATIYREVNQREATPECANRMMGHFEYAWPRKVDPRLSYDEMELLRARARDESLRPGRTWTQLWP